MVKIPDWVQERKKTKVSAQKQLEREQILPLHFRSILVSNRLNEAYPYWGRQSALLSLPTQMLTSSRNILIDTSTILCNQVSEHPIVELAHKINHHTWIAPNIVWNVSFRIVYLHPEGHPWSIDCGQCQKNSDLDVHLGDNPAPIPTTTHFYMLRKESCRNEGTHNKGKVEKGYRSPEKSQTISILIALWPV